MVYLLFASAEAIHVYMVFVDFRTVGKMETFKKVICQVCIVVPRGLASRTKTSKGNISAGRLSHIVTIAPAIPQPIPKLFVGAKYVNFSVLWCIPSVGNERTQQKGTYGHVQIAQNAITLSVFWRFHFHFLKPGKSANFSYVRSIDFKYDALSEKLELQSTELMWRRNRIRMSLRIWASETSVSFSSFSFQKQSAKIPIIRKIRINTLVAHCRSLSISREESE